MRFRDRAKIFRDPRFSNNHSISLVSQTIQARKNFEKRVSEHEFTKSTIAIRFNLLHSICPSRRPCYE